MDFLVQPALCHHPVGKVGGEFKIAGSRKCQVRTPLKDKWWLKPAAWDFFLPVCPDLTISQVILVPYKERRCRMHTIQAFLIVVLSALVWITIILSLALAEEVTIYDKDWRVKERTQDWTIYDRDWRVKGHIEDGRVYDRNWRD